MPYRKILTMSAVLLIVLAANSKGDTITGSGTANYITKFTGTATVGNSILYESSGNIGIGTTTPNAKLEVVSPGDTILSVIHNSSNGGPAFRFYGVRTTNNAVGGVEFYNSGTQVGAIYGQRANANDALDLFFSTRTAGGSLTDKMVIKSNGNVGIGTTGPASKLHVDRNAGGNGTIARFFDSSAADGTYNGIYFGKEDAAGKDGFVNYYLGTTAQSYADSWIGIGHNGDVGGTATLNIKKGGNVGIGTTSPTVLLTLAKNNAIGIATSDGSDNGYLSITAGGADTDATRGAKIALSGNERTGQTGTLELSMGNVAGSYISFERENAAEYMRIINGGNVGIGTTTPSKKLTVRGNILVERSNGTACLELGDGLDYAEGFNLSDSSKTVPGSVLVIDSDNPGRLTLSTKAYDTKVAGIVAGANNLGSGVRLGVGQHDCDVALAGRVYCNVDATQSAIQPGDLLTTSDVPGYAMKATDHTRAQGAILGKAMQGLEKGKKSQILVLVTLQ